MGEFYEAALGLYGYFDRTAILPGSSVGGGSILQEIFRDLQKAGVAVSDFGLLRLAVKEYVGPDVFRPVQFFDAVEICIFCGTGDAAVSVRKGKKDSGCLYTAGGCQAGTRVLRFSFIVSGTVFPAYGKKDSGTAYRELGWRTDQRYWLLLCHIGCTLAVEAS